NLVELRFARRHTGARVLEARAEHQQPPRPIGSLVDLLDALLDRLRLNLVEVRILGGRGSTENGIVPEERAGVALSRQRDPDRLPRLVDDRVRAVPVVPKAANVDHVLGLDDVLLVAVDAVPEPRA